MLETLREYALEKLAEMDLITSARQAYAHYFLSLGERAHTAYYTSDHVYWLDLLRLEDRNLSAAVDYYHVQSDGVEAELRMVGSLGWFWIHVADPHEGCLRMRAALERDRADIFPEARIRAYYAAAMMERSFANYALAIELHGRMLTLAREVGYQRGTVQALLGMAIDFHFLNDLQRAMALNEEGITTCLQTDEPVLLATLYQNQGLVLNEIGQTDTALSLLNRALQIARSEQHANLLQHVLSNLANLYSHLGEYERSTEYYSEAYGFARRIGDRQACATNLLGLAENRLVQEDYDRTRDLTDQSLSIAQELGNLSLKIVCVMCLAQLAWKMSQHKLAEALAREAAAAALATAERRLQEETLQLLAVSLARNGDAFRAARLLGALHDAHLRLRTLMNRADLLEFEQVQISLRRQLGEAAFRSAYDEGMQMSVEAALVYALDPSRQPGANGMLAAASRIGIQSG
jgi:tetratricopeptide (TPR) repeat protein